jgi:glycosyltransferase involved in cell wall biosynthesis
MNGIVACRPKTGIGHYLQSLHEQSSPPTAADRLSLFPGARTLRLLQTMLGAGGKPASSAMPAPVQKAGSSWKARPVRFLQRAGSLVFRRAFRMTANKLGCDLYHEPNYIPWDCDVPAVATIHDLSVLLYPEWHPADRVKLFERQFLDGLGRCVHLITDSQFIRQQLVQKLGVNPNRVTAVHLGIRKQFQPLAASEVLPVLAGVNLRPGYLLHVGTIEPRKNLLMLMRAYCDLPHALRERSPLVLVGGWGWRNENIREFYETTARHAGVIRLGYVPDEQMPALYNGARAMVFPSHYEGFGFPPLEMTACGGAVLASSAAALREVLPRDWELLHPDDRAGWRDAMHDMLVDDDYWRQSKRGAVEHSRSFSWRRCARETWAVYEKTAKGTRSLPPAGYGAAHRLQFGTAADKSSPQEELAWARGLTGLPI